MTKWRFLNTGFNNGAFNMAVDEAIMHFVAQGSAPPTLRFYGWKPPAISLGFFQKVEREIDLAACEQLGISVVRRSTGGRAILHENELTYSILLGENYPGLPPSISESYKLLSSGLLAGFILLGVKAELAPANKVKPANASSPACFDALSTYEISVNGKKIAGSAQIRKGGALLQHGSIINDLDADKFFACLAFPDEPTREKAKKNFLEKATCIKNETGNMMEWERLCTAFYQGFVQGLNITLEPGQLSKAELSLAGELVQKYRSADWTHLR
ncbi:MAG: lipoate--protein ligase family protein [Firmicutes bacterium]|nr:lipoate--protein ligase family protein [Bacillota bacterium]